VPAGYHRALFNAPCTDNLQATSLCSCLRQEWYSIQTLLHTKLHRVASHHHRCCNFGIIYGGMLWCSRETWRLINPPDGLGSSYKIQPRYNTLPSKNGYQLPDVNHVQRTNMERVTEPAYGSLVVAKCYFGPLLQVLHQFPVRRMLHQFPIPTMSNSAAELSARMQCVYCCAERIMMRKSWDAHSRPTVTSSRHSSSPTGLST
jgi:hypothetical protein